MKSFDLYHDKKSGEKFAVPITYTDLVSAFDSIPESIFDFKAAAEKYESVQLVQDESLKGIVVSYFNKCGSRFPRVLKAVGSVLIEQDYKTSLEITVEALKESEKNIISTSIALNRARDEFDRKAFNEQFY